MAEMKLKELYKSTGMGSPFIFKSDFTYPEFAETNFLEDYIAEASVYDNYFLKEHGAKLVDFDSEEMSDIKEEWEDMLEGIYTVYVNAWAHIYDTLNIAYNPVYNVEEHIITKYGAHETEVEYGAHETEMEYGNTSDTLGTHTDTATNYGVAMDSAEEKETGKTTNVIGQQTNTSTAHTDTETSKTHTDTTTSKLHTDTETSKLHTDTTTSKLHTDEVNRTGNIGIKSATALATEEIFMRERQIFFKNIFLTISREIGAYYELNY